MKTISSLPDDTFVFCGHEYTVANFKWAINIDVDNKNVHEKYKWALA